MRKSRNQRVTQASRWQTGLGLFVGLIIFATVSVISFRLPAIAQEDTRAVGTVSIESTQPGELAVSWDAPTETPRDYRISWARADQDYSSREDSSANAFPTDTSYTITGLDEGVRYKVRVRARYDGTSGPFSASVEAVIASAPTLTSAPVPTITATTVPAETTTATPTVTHTPQPQQAQDPQHTATSTATSTPTATPTAAPTSALALAARVAESAVELSWNAVQGAARYELWVWDSVNDWQQIGGNTLAGTSYTHTDVAAGTTYFYSISTVDAGGQQSPWSPYQSVTVPAETTTATPTATHTPQPQQAQDPQHTATSTATSTPTATPTAAPTSALALAARVAESAVELSWNAVQGAARYELWVWDSVNDWQQIGGNTLAGTSYTHTDVAAGTTYFYSISTVDAGGQQSPWSPYQSVTVPAETTTATPTATHTPQPQQAQDPQHTATSTATSTPTATPTAAPTSALALAARVAESAVELSWNAVQGAARYELWVWDSVNDWRQIGGNTLAGTSYTHTGVAAGTTYFYSIRTVDADGQQSPWSPYLSVTVPAPDQSSQQQQESTATPTAMPKATPDDMTVLSVPIAPKSMSQQQQESTATPTATPTATSTATPSEPSILTEIIIPDYDLVEATMVVTWDPPANGSVSHYILTRTHDDQGVERTSTFRIDGTATSYLVTVR